MLIDVKWFFLIVVGIIFWVGDFGVYKMKIVSVVFSFLIMVVMLLVVLRFGYEFFVMVYGI